MGDEERRARLHSPTRADRSGVLVSLAWVAVLVLTATFHAIRGAPVDAAIYGVGALVLVLDLLGWLRVPVRVRADGGLASHRLVVAAFIAVAAVTVAISPLYGAADAAVVVGIGVLVLPVAWADRGARRRPGEPAESARADRTAVRRAALLWSLVIAAGCAWEIGAFFLGRGMSGDESEFPALSDLLDPVVAWPPARAALVALWLLGGYALLRRGWRR